MKTKATFLLLLTFLLSFNANSQNEILSYSFTNNLKDSSKNSNHLETFGSGDEFKFVQGVSGKSYDSAIQFQSGKGLRSQSSIDNSSWSGVSASVWVKDCANGQIYGGAYFGGSVSADRGKIRVFYAQSSSSGYAISSKNLDDGEWHHVVAQNNGSKTSIYIDRKLDTTRNEKMFRISSPTPSARAYFGLTRLEWERLEGSIDHFKLFDDTLSAKQISDLYYEGKATTGIADLDPTKKKILIYPNPFSAILNFGPEVHEVVVNNLQGQELMNSVLSSNKLEVEDLSAGIYILDLTNKEGELIGRERVIKE
jgi:hypothetical protein